MLIADYLPFALLSVTAAVICLWLARYAWRRRTVAGAQEFALLMVAVAWGALAGAADFLISAHAFALKLLASKLYIIGGASASLLVFLFAVRYTHRDHWLTRRWLVILWGLVAIDVFLALTNDWHSLYWPEVGVSSDAPNASLVFTHNALSYFLLFFSYGVMFAGGAIIIYSAMRAPDIYRAQSVIMVIAVLIPVLANVVYYVGIGPEHNLDFTSIAFGISGMLIAWAIFRFQLLDLAPIAQDALFANLRDGVIAVNERTLIVAANPAAQALLGADERALLGVPAPGLPAPWGDAIAAALAGSHGEIEVRHRERSFSIASSDLRGHGRSQVGHILMMHDVTAYRMLQDSLVALNSELEARVAARTVELSQSVAHLQSEVDERERVEAALRNMQDSLADHVTGLSSQLSVLYEVILLGGRSIDLDEVRRLTLETIASALHADAGFLLTYLPGPHTLEPAVRLGLAAGQLDHLPPQETEWLLSDPIPRTILNLPAATDIPESLRIAGMQACVLNSIVRMGTPVGVLGVYWREQPSLSVEEIALFRALGDQLAVLAENVRLRAAHDQALVQEERQRIARELHDSVTQSLYALTLGADTAADRLRSGRTDRLDDLMAKIGMAAHQALREMRLLLYELRLATPDNMPLADALQMRLDAVEQRAGIDARLEIDVTDIPAAVAQHLYWIAIEALNNSLKHAAAQHVTVRIHMEGGAIEMIVVDDGVGLGAQAGSTRGFGLRSMAERAAQLGGTLSVSAPHGRGAQVTVLIPQLIPHRQEAAAPPGEHKGKVEVAV